MDRIEVFTKTYFTIEKEDDIEERSKRLKHDCLELLQPDTIKAIECVISEGPGGPNGWRELFLESEKRRALICAIVGSVITEQVYQHVFLTALKSPRMPWSRSWRRIAIWIMNISSILSSRTHLTNIIRIRLQSTLCQIYQRSTRLQRWQVHYARPALWLRPTRQSDRIRHRGTPPPHPLPFAAYEHCTRIYAPGMYTPSPYNFYIMSSCIHGLRVS